MNFNNKIKHLLRQYQTRQHLRNLPEHLFKDIKQSRKDIAVEINKSAVISIALSALRRLMKGS